MRNKFRKYELEQESINEKNEIVARISIGLTCYLRFLHLLIFFFDFIRNYKIRVDQKFISCENIEF